MMMSSPPNRVTVWVMTARTPSGLVTSQLSTCKAKPCFAASRANSSFPAVSMPHATTWAPPAAKRIAIPRPIPVVPVTRDTRPANSFIGVGSAVRTSLQLLLNRDDQHNALPGQFRNGMLQAIHDAAQFSKPLQSAHQRVAGIYFFAEVVGQQVSVVGTHGNFMVWPAHASPMRLFLHHSVDHPHHIGAAGQVLRFMKGSVWLSDNLPKVRKVKASTEFASHGQQIVVGSCAERPDTERQPVCERIARSENRPHILVCGDDSREAKQ